MGLHTHGDASNVAFSVRAIDRLSHGGRGRSDPSRFSASLWEESSAVPLVCDVARLASVPCSGVGLKLHPVSTGAVTEQHVFLGPCLVPRLLNIVEGSLLAME